MLHHFAHKRVQRFLLKNQIPGDYALGSRIFYSPIVLCLASYRRMGKRSETGRRMQAIAATRFYQWPSLPTFCPVLSVAARQAWSVLIVNTLAFTVCMVWMMFGVIGIPSRRC